ncbi:hypothetical protein [Sphingobium sp. HDIP04]|uniref:hypothetical protein n=1 Tax=Sphingobium sp. HDIP04 TaxID=428994 RepID=UPI0003879934|nr:hypothetical protein [Sphingobium sp. HDIP04]EQA97298.1 hypothetical protein L286_23525 [Sphingobium sp. HDIP04]
MPANLQHRVAVFNALRSRAVEKRPGLSRNALMTACNIDDDEVLDDALHQLEGSDHIRVDMWGKYPAVVVLKAKWRNGEAVFWPVPASDPTPVPAAPKHDAVPTKAVEPVKMPPYKFQTPEHGSGSASHPTASAPASTPPPPPEMPVAPVEAAVRMKLSAPKRSNNIGFNLTNPADVAWLSDLYGRASRPGESYAAFCRGIFLQALDQIRADAEAPVLVLKPARGQSNLVSFTLTDSEMDALLEALDVHPHPIRLDAFAKLLCVTELDRLASADAPRHRLSAEVMRAAREEGVPLGEFVTRMVSVGMQAREMNRRGL